ncbi:MAG: SH3 domain-containing protein [Blautia sp.]|uniref:GH25 family lysozyme n=1 Tax=Blautia sp. TaxID=1955243 RepID=UPI0025BABD34|nr:GH25 family lysozyme [Blautia sp.]MCI7449609.1 SH3 domain-containing protein [Blautia sp.]
MAEIKGIDVSRWNGKIDWKTVANYGMGFAILRITEKGNIVDSTFEPNYKGCIENKIPVGVYKYSYATTIAQIKNEANVVIKTLNKRKLDYPVFLDIEDKCQENLSDSLMMKIIEAFRAIIVKAGYKFGIYCGYSWYQNQLPKGAKKYDCWVANYPKPQLDNGTLQERLRVPASTGVIGWQYSPKSTIPGISTKVDRSVFYKDYSKSSTTSTNTSNNNSNKTPQGSDNMSNNIIQNVINDAVSFAVGIANDNSHGYSQAVRSLYNITNPKSYDCSSLCCTAYYYAFLKNGLTAQANYLKSHCSYTGNMLNMLNVGFEIVARNQTAHAQMQKGDLELNVTHHVAMAIDRNNIVHARSSEGTTNTIDDSGNEIRTQPWYEYSHGWTHRLRFTGKGLNLSNIKPSTTTYNKWVGAATKDDTDVFANPTGTSKLSTYPKLNKGNLVDVIGVSGTRYQVKIADKFVGYVEKSNIKDPNAVVTKPSASTSKTKYPFVGEVTASELNVRTGTGTNYGKLSSYPILKRGNLVDVLKEKKDTSGNKWYQVRIAGKYTGYVSSKYIKKK